MAASDVDITGLLRDWSNGRREALDELLPQVYVELKRLAASYLRREGRDQTFQPTALVHEAFMKLVGQHGVQWANRAHFFGIAARLMRRILIDEARARKAAKRGAGAHRSHLDPELVATNCTIDLVAMDDALTGLAERDPRQAQIVELRYFGGLTIDETAEVLGISSATVSREWTVAKAWLYDALRDARP